MKAFEVDTESVDQGIEVKCKAHWFAPHLLFSPRVWIDGGWSDGRWGTEFFETAPGNHSVRIEVRYFGLTVGIAATDVYVHEGHKTHITYQAPIFLWMSSGQIVTAPSN